MALISPILWQGIPFRHPEGEPDFYGFHDKWHRALAVHVGPTVADYRFDALADMGDIHQRVHEELARTLGLDGPSDFSLYDLRQRSGWVLFQQLHSLEHERLRAATGI